MPVSMYIESTKDIWYLVLSLCAVWFTVFLCWSLYQVGRALKNINIIVEKITHLLGTVSDTVDFVKDKVHGVSDKMSSVGGFVSDLIQKIIMSKMTSEFSEKVKDDKRSKRTRRG